MSRSAQSIGLAAVGILSLALLAADAKPPHVDTYALQIAKVEIPIQEAINKVMEEHGGIPFAASLQPREDGPAGFVFWVQTIRPAKEGIPASIWAIGIDANTGDLLGTHNQTLEKERELTNQAQARTLRTKERRLREELHERKLQEQQRRIKDLEQQLEKQKNAPKPE